MEINQLCYFLEVAQSQHITKSAEKLHIAQPALSQAIHRLEKDLGVPLFVSKGRNIMLTEYGIYLQAKLLPIMAELDDIPLQLQTMAKLESETIHLNVLAASALVTDAIIEYKKTHVNINFQFMQTAESDLYDICVTTTLSRETVSETKDSTYICTENIFLAVPQNHKFAGKSSVALSECAQEDFISLMGSRQLRWICDKYCQRAGFAPRIIFESDSPIVVKNMIAASMGIGFWPEFTWGDVDTGSLVLLGISDPSCKRDIIIDYKKNKTDVCAVEDFFCFLKQYMFRKFSS